MSIYAWVGQRDGQGFDRDTANFSTARAVSEKDAHRFSVQHELPSDASRIAGNGALIVDLDRRSSVEFAIQLLDEEGALLERECVPIEIEVESRAVRVDAEDVRAGWPDPDLFSIGRDIRSDTRVLADETGSAVFHLRGPARDERLDTLTIEADCCTKQVHRVAWSDGESVLVATPPAFDLYHRREGDRIEFTVAFDLVDQYGESLRGTDPRYTGRPNTEVEAWLDYQLYHAPTPGADRIYTVREIPEVEGAPGIKINRRGVTADIEIEIPAAYRDGHEFLVRIEAQIFSDKDDDDTLDAKEVRYVDGDLIVWVVNNARDEAEFDVIRDRDFATPPGLDLEEVELYASGRKYRTFFTLWSYRPSHMFQANGAFVDVKTFETLWRKQVDGIDDLDVLIYGSGFSLTVIK